jgi:insertion element IS1 protein InsB
LPEHLSLAAIVRITGVSARWLQSYVNQKYEQISQKVEVTQKKVGKLTIQLDEMWSFVGNKQNKKWIWLAIDADTREIVGAYIGERSRRSAKRLWSSITIFLFKIICKKKAMGISTKSCKVKSRKSQKRFRQKF